jgi:hypothetical protein
MEEGKFALFHSFKGQLIIETQVTDIFNMMQFKTLFILILNGSVYSYRCDDLKI